MSVLLKRFLVLVLLWPMALFAAEGQVWEAGKHYEVLKYPVRVEQPGKIEVAEVFWYGCPHCRSFKPMIEAWEKGLADDVNFLYMPAALGRSWEIHARAFYAAEALGVFDKTHDALFEALAKNPHGLANEDQLAAFFVEQGVEEAQFRKAFKSFGVNARLEQAQSKIRGAMLTGVPALLINGKYKTSASMAGSLENVLKVADFLIEQERKAATAQN